MFCPQCGQQQVSDEIRFCPRCGFSLAVVVELIAYDGVLPAHSAETGKPSRRQREMRKSLVLLLTSFFLTLLLLAFTKMGAPLELFAMIAALFSGIICFFGVFQFLSAYLKDDDAPDDKQTASSDATPARPAPLDSSARRNALPSAPGTPATDWQRSTQTAEMERPASVTEHTTKLLDEETVTRGD
jgi:hypothetical protein